MMKNKLLKYGYAICVLGVLFQLWGCSSSKIQLSELPATTLPHCKDMPEGVLPIQKGCYMDVAAIEPANQVGLKIEKGQEFVFRIRGDQWWYDKTRLSKPLCGEPGSWIMNAFRLFKERKSKDSLWFSMIAELEGENRPYDLCPSEREDKTTGRLQAKGSGMLLLYANDVEGFYDNNQGIIRVEIERTR